MPNFTGTAQALDLALAGMLVRWPKIIDKPTLMSIIQPLTGLQPTSVIWDKDPRPMVSDIDRALVTLSIKNYILVGGSDEKRRTFSSGPTPPLTSHYLYEIAGQRQVVLTLKCEVYDYQAEAGEILERVATMLNANFELSAINLAYQNSKLVTDLPTTYDNRVVNIAVLDIFLGATSSVQISDQVAQGWIDTVNAPGQPPGTNDITGTFS